MKTFNKKMVGALIALFVLLSSSLGVLAFGGDYEMVPASAGTFFRFKNSNNNNKNIVRVVKENYNSSDLRTYFTDYRTTNGNTNDPITDDKGDTYYYNEFNTKYVNSEQIKWVFAPEGPGHNNMGENVDAPAGIKDNIVVYDDESLADDHIVASASNNSLSVTAGKSPGTNPIFWVTIPENTLEAKKTYYLCFTKEFYIKDADSSLGYPIIFKFETCESHDHVSYVSKESKDPTCTEAGWTKEEKCSFCEKLITESTSLPALGHNYGEFVVTKEPTCTENGTEEQECTRCGEKNTKTIPAKGHDWDGDKCKVCGADYVLEELGTWHVGSPNEQDVTATLYSDGTFVLEGNGDTKNFSKSQDQPWNSNKDTIKSVEVKPGVTSIGNFFFQTCSNLNAVSIKGEETFTFGRLSFGSCNALESVTIDCDAEKTTFGGASFAGVKKAVWHVKCDQVEAFKGNGKIPSGTYQKVVGDIHNFENGICTRCGEKDPDYVDPEPAMTLTSSKDTLTLNSYTTLTVNGGQEGYTYHFDVKNNGNGNEWAPWEGFQNKSSFNWYAGPTSGNKTITATVKDADGNQVGEPLPLTVDVAPSDLLLSTIGCDNSNPLATDTVNLNAAATGGSESYEYRFRVQNNNTGKWWTIQDWDAKNEATWYAGPAGGSKTLYFDVKDTETGDTVTKKMIVGVQDTELKVDSITIDPENLTAATTTKLTANVANASEDLEYRFYVYNNGTGKLWQIQDYKKGGNTCNWYAGPAGGSKTIYVDVKDGDTITSLVLDVTVAE